MLGIHDEGIARAGSEINIPHPKPAMIWKPCIRAGTAMIFGKVPNNEKPRIWSSTENKNTYITGSLSLPVAVEDHAAPNGAAK